MLIDNLNMTLLTLINKLLLEMLKRKIDLVHLISNQKKEIIKQVIKNHHIDISKKKIKKMMKMMMTIITKN